MLEAQIAADITARVEQTVLVPVAADPQRLSQLLDDLTLSAEQRGAVDRGLARSFSVIVGGPGTGKTHTVAALLVALLDHAPTEEPLRIALAAPTGKAAARMGEAIAAAASRLATLPLEGAPALAEQLTRAEPSTIHRLLGTIPDSTRFRHDRIDPLPHDVVIIDETSMVSLPLLAKLLAAVPPTSRVVLVGDPGQLASVEAGSVLGDIAGPVVLAADGGPDAPATALADSITVLRESRRFPTESPVGRFAAAVRTGERGLQGICRQYGRATVQTFLDQYQTYAEEMASASISRLPAGRVTREVFYDSDTSLYPDGIPVRATLDVDPAAAKVTIDLRDNVDNLPLGINMTRQLCLPPAATPCSVFSAPMCRDARAPTGVSRS